MAADGNITSVAYSSTFHRVGTMMNVDNPHPLLLLHPPGAQHRRRRGTGQSRGRLDAEVSWDWDTHPGPASLPTALFVDVRGLITAPQYAAYDIWESLFTGDPAAVINAIDEKVADESQRGCGPVPTCGG